MRKGILLITIMSMSILAIACGNNQKQEDISKETEITTTKSQVKANEKLNDLTVSVKNNVINENNKKALNINSQADFSKFYKNTQDLINADAPSIVYGEITDLNYTNLEEGVYTNLSVTVTESFKGDLKANDIISVFENGGITTYKDYMKSFGKEMVTKEFASKTKQPADDELVVSHFDGTEFSKKEQKVVLFLTKSKGDIIPKGAYECIGAYMGKLTLDKDKFVRTKSDNDDKSFYTDKKDDLKKNTILSKMRNIKNK